VNAEEPRFVPLAFERLPEDAMLERAQAFRTSLSRRRSVREFSPQPVPLEVLEEAIRAAGTAPSGAHQQPWQFVAITNPDVKRKIREAAEEEERRNYGERFPEGWLRALAPLGTDERKPHLEVAPVLIVVFAERRPPAGSPHERHYYVSESVGIATGFLIAALHDAGLATLTHTPNPMKFLSEILGRPENETAYVLMPVGYPADDAKVPDLERKPLDAIRTWVH
jgi:iodotyrosine deiodinase